MADKMYRPEHKELRHNPHGENDRAPSHISSQRSHGNMGEHGKKGKIVNPHEIPNSLGYVGKRIHK